MYKDVELPPWAKDTKDFLRINRLGKHETNSFYSNSIP